MNNDLTLLIPAKFEAESLPIFLEELKDYDYKKLVVLDKTDFLTIDVVKKFDDIEIKPEDIDEYIGVEAAKYGATAEQLKSYYAQNPNQLENLRNNIRENKVFDKLTEEVTINELSKDEFRKKREEENEKKQIPQV